MTCEDVADLSQAGHSMGDLLAALALLAVAVCRRRVGEPDSPMRLDEIEADTDVRGLFWTLDAARVEEWAARDLAESPWLGGLLASGEDSDNEVRFATQQAAAC